MKSPTDSPPLQSPASAKSRSASHPDNFSALEIADDDVAPLLSRRHSQTWCCGGEAEACARTAVFGGAAAPVFTEPSIKFPANVVRNQKYSLISFLPLVLFEQFRFFFNLYFLLVAISQAFPSLKVGLTFTYVAPLVFVLAVTLTKECVDDFKRYRRDVEANSQLYERLIVGDPKCDEEMALEASEDHAGDGAFESELVPSSRLRVGDLVVLHPDQRVPADLVLMRTRDRTGTVFIRTDQLDGETDWKLRHAVPSTQQLPLYSFIRHIKGRLEVGAPHKAIYEFAGCFSHVPEDDPEQIPHVEGLGLEHTMWANTVVATGTVIGCVIYTGKETRSVLNSNKAPSKIGLVDLELNNISKVLFLLMCLLSVLLLLLKGLNRKWYMFLFRYILLFSSIIPISLRVNLDMAKTLYAWQIMKDEKIAGTVVRTSTIPEELGRISYLFSDKTGTLTQNVMEFKKLQLRPPLFFDRDNMQTMKDSLKRAFRRERSSVVDESDGVNVELDDEVSVFERRRQDEADSSLLRCVLAMALCHNVTPVEGDEEGPTFMAASPDEVALVKLAQSLNLTLEHREQQTIRLRSPEGDAISYDVLHIFPFTSETKRMGIVVRSLDTGEIIFYLKGAESVMRMKVEQNDWLDEEVEAMAREGLRTLVFGQRHLSNVEYEEFNQKYLKAKAVIRNREAQLRSVIQTLEQGLELVGLSGVEDKLQKGVKNTLETLRNAGVKVWMLTGDKAETAMCIGRSARLVDRNQEVFPITVTTKRDAARRLDTFGTRHGACLLVDGTSLSILLEHLEHQFFELAHQAPSVICCRCSPTQKAEVVELMKDYTGRRCCAIGDGGNDVSMIQAAHVGVGIVGKEGKQASLAADFSVNQFSYIQRLMLWHGRNAYKRSARMSQFVMHRGLIISIVQAVFSALFYFAAIPIYTGWLMVGYATVYTQLPVCALVLDEDVDESLVSLYPELYQELQKGRPLSYKTFFSWVLKSVYQGGVIMSLSIFLFEEKFINIVAITFTALILSELLNVAFEIQKWRPLMVFAEVISFLLYFISMFALPQYFDLTFIFTLDFVWKSLLITTISCLPVSFGMYLQRKYAPTTASKVH